MAKLATRKEMNQAGWINVDINGVDCIQLGDGMDMLIAQWTNDGYMTPEAYNLITAQLGEPYKVHNTWSPEGRELIMTLEY